MITLHKRWPIFSAKYFCASPNHTSEQIGNTQTKHKFVSECNAAAKNEPNDMSEMEKSCVYCRPYEY